MDGPEHYSQAERLLDRARDKASDKDFYREEGAVPALLAALAHATLANAAAVALSSSAPGSRAWADVAGTKLSDGA